MEQKDKIRKLLEWSLYNRFYSLQRELLLPFLELHMEQQQALTVPRDKIIDIIMENIDDTDKMVSEALYAGESLCINSFMQYVESAVAGWNKNVIDNKRPHALYEISVKSKQNDVEKQVE